MPAQVPWVRVQWTNKTAGNVHWAPAARATNYQVRVTYQSQLIQAHSTAGQNYTITGLQPNHTYGVHVVAINGSNWAPETSTTMHTSK